ncbi:tRNA epoxyqueuosine(34) reductase QueG [Planctomycetota bacterium]|nr:tRNA epoxyqueuosine(34) reductase QueG [Planctomycetota bacterium]
MPTKPRSSQQQEIMPDQPPKQLQHQQIIELAQQHGFVLAGIASANPTKYPDALKQWIDNGMHGEMDYLANHLDVRLDPNNLLKNAQSVICLADAYFPILPNKADSPASSADQPNENPVNQPHNEQISGRVARYAWGSDYHKVLKKRLFKIADELKTLFPDHEFRCTTDTAPILEREYATAAGLGWTGKHTLLIHPKLGSYLLLGTIVTTLPLPTTEQVGYPAPNIAPDDHCGSCTRCIDACPTQCISSDGYSLDGSRCISYLTLEHRSEIPIGFHDQIGEWIAGCDVCQEVCPHNRHGNHAPLDKLIDAYKPKSHLAAGLPLYEILDWTADDRQQTFMGSAIKRIKLNMIQRNAIVALTNQLINQEDHHLLIGLKQKLISIAQDDGDDMVRKTAIQSIQRIEEYLESNHD